MWEKTNQTNGEKPPSRPKAEKRGREDRVLRVQMLFCGVILTAALLVRQLLPDAFAVFSAEYLNWLEQGISITQKDKVYRFASGQIDLAMEVAARLEEAFARAAAPREEM